MQGFVRRLKVGLLLCLALATCWRAAAPTAAGQQPTPVIDPREREEVRELSARATKLYGEGKYGEALPPAERALAIMQKTLGPSHPDVAVSLGNLATMFEGKGDFARAVEFGERGQEVWERNFALVLSTGSERQKLAYLNTHAGETCAVVSLHAVSAPSDRRALRLSLTTVLRRKGARARRPERSDRRPAPPARPAGARAARSALRRAVETFDTHTRRAGGEGRTEALRQVQLEMLRSDVRAGAGRARGLGGQLAGGGALRTHPYFWAAFIQSGDWRPMADR